MAEKKLIGKLPRDAIRMLELPRLSSEIVEGFKALVDLTGTIFVRLAMLSYSG